MKQTKQQRALPCKVQSILMAGVLTALLLSGCSGVGAASSGASAEQTAGQSTGAVTGTSAVQNVSFATVADDYFFDWSAQSYTEIDLAQGDVTLTKSGVYVLAGSLTDGSVTVNVDKNADEGTVYLVLNGASLNSESGTPLWIAEAKKVCLLLEAGTENTVTQGAITTTDTEFPSAAVFSKADMTITGSGALTVTTQYNDGITSKDDLLITGGTLRVTAVGDGIVGKDLLAVETADITIDAGKDGMRATNATDEGKGNVILAGGTFAVTAANDAIQAEKTLQIDGGTFSLQTGGGYAGSIKTSETMGGFGGGRGGDLAGVPPANIGNGEAPTGTPPADPAEGTATEGTPPEPPSGTGEPASAEGQMPDVQQTVEQEDDVETQTAESDSKKALKAGGNLIVNGGSFTLSAYEDAVHANGNVTIADGTFAIQAGDDAVHADASVVISGGTLNIQNSFEGVEGANVTLAGGTVNIVSDDDGVNVNSQTGVLTMDGGAVSVKAGGDGVDSNGNLVINGGTLTIDTSLIGSGNNALDYDGTYSGTGGTVLDENGSAIDPSVRTGPGGGGGGKGGGTRPGMTAGGAQSGAATQA